MRTAQRPSRKRYILLGVATIGVFTSVASANPGTAMIFVVAFHLFIGNLIIGIIEWIGLALLGASKARAAIMIPANYISAFAGVFILGSILPISTMLGDDIVANVVWVSWAALIVLTILGIIIELPFVFLAFKKPRNSKRVIAAAILVNIFTGGLVAGFYAINANLSLASNFESVPLEEVIQEYIGPDLWIYYIDDENQTINRMRLDGRSQDHIIDMPVESPDAPSYNFGYWLTLHNGIGNDKLDLYLASPIGWYFDDDFFPVEPDADPYDWHIFLYDVQGRVLKEDIAKQGSVWRDIKTGNPSSPLGMSTYAADLREPDDTNPKIELDHIRAMYPVEITYPDGTTEHLALINAITSTSATIKVVSVLPGDLIVFMLGGIDSTTSRGIYIASLRTHKIAKIGNGRSPLVVIEDAS